MTKELIQNKIENIEAVETYLPEANLNRVANAANALFRLIETASGPMVSEELLRKRWGDAFKRLVQLGSLYDIDMADAIKEVLDDSTGE